MLNIQSLRVKNLGVQIFIIRAGKNQQKVAIVFADNADFHANSQDSQAKTQ